MTTSDNKHTISLYVANKPGVLIRVALVFARRGYNLDSLVVSEGHDPLFSHMTISATGDRKTLDQILKQLNKLVDVVHAKDHTEDPVIEREMALVKIKCPADKRGEILQMAHIFDCETIDLTQDTITLQITGETTKLDNVHTMFGPFGILEMVRTGKVLIMPGAASTS
jgi:acetolactate synthase I/III small subunit